jgi:serine/threonine protein kinase
MGRAPRIGEMLDHYRIVREIGAGGMGVVYEATDVRLERPVALKLLPAAFAADASRRARSMREAKSGAARIPPRSAA